MMLVSVWFFLWALLWAVYFMLDGFDLGTGILFPFLARSEREKLAAHAATGPFWDGNEVWLIAAGGVTFAAFPEAYAVMFSALYAPLLLLLFSLIFRAVSLEFRGKVSTGSRRDACDFVYFASSFAAALLLGVAFANLFMGIPIGEGGSWHGSLFGLLNLYGLCGGVLFVLIFALHGALWLRIKTGDRLGARADAAAYALWPAVLSMLLVFLWMTAYRTSLFAVWGEHPVFYVFLVLGVICFLGSRMAFSSPCPWPAWLLNSGFILFTAIALVLGMWPGMIISSIDPAFTVTAPAAASSPLTLAIMLGVVLCAVPVVILYQIWVYRIFAEPLEGGH